MGNKCFSSTDKRRGKKKKKFIMQDMEVDTPEGDFPEDDPMEGSESSTATRRNGHSSKSNHCSSRSLEPSQEQKYKNDLKNAMESRENPLVDSNKVSETPNWCSEVVSESQTYRQSGIANKDIENVDASRFSENTKLGGDVDVSKFCYTQQQIGNKEPSQRKSGHEDSGQKNYSHTGKSTYTTVTRLSQEDHQRSSSTASTQGSTCDANRRDCMHKKASKGKNNNHSSETSKISKVSDFSEHQYSSSRSVEGSASYTSDTNTKQHVSDRQYERSREGKNGDRMKKKETHRSTNTPERDEAGGAMGESKKGGSSPHKVEQTEVPRETTTSRGQKEQAKTSRATESLQTDARGTLLVENTEEEKKIQAERIRLMYLQRLPVLKDNIGERIEVGKYGEMEWRGMTENSKAMREGYAKLPEMTRLRHLRRIKGDNYCGVRSCLFQFFLKRKRIDIPYVLQELKKVSGLDHWNFGNRFPMDGKVSKIKVVEAFLSRLVAKLHDVHKLGVNSERECINIFNDDQVELMEAGKLLMLAKAMELYEQRDTNLLAMLLFARDTSQTMTDLVRNHLNCIGDTGGIDQLELSLLGCALQSKINVYHPSRYDKDDFCVHFPPSDFGPLVPENAPVLNLIAEDDRHYNILLEHEQDQDSKSKKTENSGPSVTSL